jgi:uncharacterized protein (DUF1501 family)
MTRRTFLKNSAKNTMILPFLSISVANSLFGAKPTFNNYKAIVVIHLHGGNDAFNTFVPTDSDKHTDYYNARKKIAIANTNLADDTNFKLDANGYYKSSKKIENPYKAEVPTNPTEIEPQDELDAIYRKGIYKFNNDPLGINGMMPEFAALYKKGVVSIVSKVGTLVEPTANSDIANQSANLPLFLFAHDHQRRAVQTAKAQQKINSGWLGRVADSWAPINDTIGLNISLKGINTMLVGNKTSPLSFGKKPNLYTNSTIRDIIEKFSQTEDNNMFESLYKRLNLKAKKFSDKFDGIWDNVVDFSQFNAKNSYGDTLFSIPSPQDIGIEEPVHRLKESLFTDLETTAKLIKLGSTTFGYKRQTFYISMGGFDSHASQPKDHLTNLRSISMALSDFYKALEEMKLHDKVVLATTSDFGRSLLSNGDGTDHGWGGHSFVMSGDSNFQGGKVLGDDITSYKLSDNNFYPQIHSKGRMIPTTSIEQMFSPILDWFGVNETTMASAFPNLKNFRTASDDNYKTAFLSGMFTQ